MTIIQCANKIEEMLRSKGFVIQRYNAYSTQSIYMKLDYGVCNTIRISDHPGKQHLQYRYNLIFGGENNIIEDKYIRYYFNENSVKDLLMQILFDKEAKLQKYGKEKYRSFMVKNMTEHQDDKGFWRDAKLVTDDPVDSFNTNSIQAWNTSFGDSFVPVQPVKVDEDTYAVGPQFALDLLKQTIADQHQLDNVARFHPGDQVKVTASFRELVDFFMQYKETKNEAETHALQILGKEGYNVGTNLGATKCDEGIFYTIELPLIPMELLPGDFLDRV